MANTKASTGRTTPVGTKPPAKKKVTSAKNWKSSARTPVELELPSGNICLAINKGMRVFLEEGKIPNSLMEIVTKSIEGAEGKTTKGQAAMAEAAEDPKMLADMIVMIDNALVMCVVEPVIMPMPTQVIDDKEVIDESVKDPDLLYVDEVDMEDKMFIFQWCVGGTDSVEKFREEFAGTLADVPSGE